MTNKPIKTKSKKKLNWKKIFTSLGIYNDCSMSCWGIIFCMDNI